MKNFFEKDLFDSLKKYEGAYYFYPFTHVYYDHAFFSLSKFLKNTMFKLPFSFHHPTITKPLKILYLIYHFKRIKIFL